MTVHFVAAGISFPEPFSISRFTPPLFNRFVTGVFYQLFCQLSVGISTIYIVNSGPGWRNNRPGKKSLCTCNSLQLTKKFKCLSRFQMCIFRFGSCVPETFHRQVATCIFAVIVIILRFPRGCVACDFQAYTTAGPWFADVAVHQLPVQIFLLISQRHPILPDTAYPSGCCNPCISIVIKSDIIYLVVHQPAATKQQRRIQFFIEPNHSNVGPNPHCTRWRQFYTIYHCRRKSFSSCNFSSRFFIFPDGNSAKRSHPAISRLVKLDGFCIGTDELCCILVKCRFSIGTQINTCIGGHPEPAFSID